MPTARFTREEISTIVAEFINGAPVTKLAAMYACSVTTINRLVRHLRKQTSKRAVFCKRKCQRIRREYERGVSSTELSIRHKCTTQTILMAVRLTGGLVRGTSQARQLCNDTIVLKIRAFTNEQEAQIRQEYESGISCPILLEEGGRQEKTGAVAVSAPRLHPAPARATIPESGRPADHRPGLPATRFGCPGRLRAGEP